MKHQPSNNFGGKHVHQYYKVDIGVNKPYIVFACRAEDCTHYLKPELVVGKICLCNRCLRRVFVMRQGHLLLIRPHCIECTKDQPTKKGPKVSDIVSNLDKLLGLAEE